MLKNVLRTLVKKKKLRNIVFFVVVGVYALFLPTELSSRTKILY